MRLTIAIGIALTMAAGTVLAECPDCPKAAGGNTAQSGGLAGLQLVSLAGDTVNLSEHVGMMPMAFLLAGTDSASGRAADVFRQAATASGNKGTMFAVVLEAGAKSAMAFAKAHSLTGMVLADPGRAALSAAMADTLPLAVFLNRSGEVVNATAEITEATVNQGMKALAQIEQKLVDPVCGMTVTKETAAGTYEYKGQTYYFCSRVCKDNFTKDPQKYLAQ